MGLSKYRALNTPAIRCSVVLFYLIAPFPVTQAAVLSPSFEDKKLTLVVTELEYPKKLIATELKSGLPNNISIILTIGHQNESVYSTTLNYKITYDLWDEVYQVHAQQGTQAPEIIKVSQQNISGFINTFKVTSGSPIEQLSASTEYQLQVRVLFNPVKTERINKIKAWIANSQGHTVDDSANNKNLIAANTTPTTRTNPLLTPGEGTANTQSTIGSARPRFQKLFDQILEQYITEDEIPALWSSEVITLQFSLDNLNNATKDD